MLLNCAYLVQKVLRLGLSKINKKRGLNCYLVSAVLDYLFPQKQNKAHVKNNVSVQLYFIGENESVQVSDTRNKLTPFIYMSFGCYLSIGIFICIH